MLKIVLKTELITFESSVHIYRLSADDVHSTDFSSEYGMSHRIQVFN